MTSFGSDIFIAEENRGDCPHQIDSNRIKRPTRPHPCSLLVLSRRNLRLSGPRNRPTQQMAGIAREAARRCIGLGLDEFERQAGCTRWLGQRAPFSFGMRNRRCEHRLVLFVTRRS